MVGAGVGAAAVLAVTVLPEHMPSTLPPIPEIPQDAAVPEVPPPEFGELSMVDIPPLPSIENQNQNDEDFGETFYIYSRAGEFQKFFLHLDQNRVFGPKNAQKKFGSPTPNFPPPKFGK